MRQDRRTPLSELQRHVFLSKDEENKTGVCRKCGPVRIYRWRGYWQCEVVYRAAKNNPTNYARNLLYGVTPEQYDAAYEAQEGKCKICHKWFAVLHVDHKHNTKKFRGLLCGNCNRGIGMFHDNTATLLSAWKYLRATNGN